MASSASHHPERELAHRDNDGIEVVLFWNELTNDLTVSVSDQRTGAYFEQLVHGKESREFDYGEYDFTSSSERSRTPW